MIIANGKIAVKLKKAGGIDPTTGHAVPSVVIGYSEQRACQIVAITQNKQARHEGEAIETASYNVFLDSKPLEGEQVRLWDEAGRVIGDFAVQRQEELKAVRQWRLHIQNPRIHGDSRQYRL